MRVLLPAAILLSVAVTAAAADTGVFIAPVDLSRPGVLERLKHDDPARYAAVTDILKAQYPCRADTLRTLKTRWDLENLECGAMLATSYPAKRLLSFELKGTPYVARVTVPPAERVQPAVE